NELTRRKDSSDLLQDFEHNTPSSPSKKHLLGGKLYPFAVVLRLRVLQVLISNSINPPASLSPSKKHLLGGKLYPFAVVLRLRVLQIVCGISALVMGTVAFIEERGQFNLGVGIIAGLSTVIAAGT
ncbi:uncharacterized protein LOC108253631, partial [Diaphorina citri]|uniref:Uncharacterized protein LOC108253631 n=1 Tax=Diaphorina citri TaxID=121845 RepID=A0A1S4EMQ1_DIACI